MSLAELRALVEAEYGPVPQEWWEDLQEDGHTSEAERGTEAGLAGLKTRIRKLMEIGAWNPAQAISRPTHKAMRPSRVAPKARQAESERPTTAIGRNQGDLFAKYIAKLADGSPIVRAFRDRYFSGNSLTAERAVALLNSPAIHFLPYSQFMNLKIPILDHKSRVFDCKLEDPSGATRVWTVDLEIVHPGRRITVRVEGSAPWDTGKRPPGLPTVTIPRYPRPDPRTRRLPLRVVFPGSVLDELRLAADELVAQYPWDKQETIWYVLTDTPPPALPIQFSSTCTKREHYSLVLLTLTMEPWLPAEVVRAAYVKMQRQFLAPLNFPWGRELS
jgi:hypothetical protein